MVEKDVKDDLKCPFGDTVVLRVPFLFALGATAPPVGGGPNSTRQGRKLHTF